MLGYLEFGKKCSGPPVILLHGLLGSKTNMAGIGKTLGEHHRVLALDLRNHGESFHHRTMTYQTMAADLGGFMDDHDIEQAAIVGHSMGGKCAMQYALSFPERVEKLAVVDIAPKRYVDPRWVKYIEAMLAIDLAALSSRKQADALLAEKIPSTIYRQFLLSNLTSSIDSTFEWKPYLHAILEARENIGAEISGPASQVEALFIRGEMSNYIEDQDLEPINDLFPRARLVTVPDIGHLVHIEARERFKELLVDFL
jgi:esterase